MNTTHIFNLLIANGDLEQDDWADWEQGNYNLIPCEDYIDTWGSSWGGGKGSVARDIFHDITGFSEMGKKVFIIYDNQKVVEDVEEFVKAYEQEEDKLIIVWKD